MIHIIIFNIYHNFNMVIVHPIKKRFNFDILTKKYLIYIE